MRNKMKKDNPEQTLEEPELYYFDPSHLNTRNALGKVFHLTLDYNNFLPGQGHESTYARETWIDNALNDLSAEELMG